jgi:hypothetical protein
MGQKGAGGTEKEKGHERKVSVLGLNVQSWTNCAMNQYKKRRKSQCFSESNIQILCRFS